ncbi:sigma-70 family RNA polymerase sigma factor [Cryobacterium tepidiphilum]|uniref:Sigma-70 family RNA polymerase sigma factor n=2 Tax=Cryobacterium tepidiphilum TaxID=2486026 RepID=A0A3M8LPK5_9MICO|nr:sigma-70 family RNA polymerase sigma factor [Cryobacterium tepidiphilum]
MRGRRQDQGEQQVTSTSVWDVVDRRRPARRAAGALAPASAEPSTVTFDELYRTFSPAVCGYLTAQRVDDPEATTHDVFLAVLPRIESLRGGTEGAKSLLFTIAHARVVDHWRRRSRIPAALEYEPDLDVRTSPSAEELAVDGSSVLSLLRVLSPEQREVLLLRIVADLSLEQVAQIMEKSVGSIKQLQRRALAALKKQPAIESWGTP